MTPGQSEVVTDLGGGPPDKRGGMPHDDWGEPDPSLPCTWCDHGFCHVNRDADGKYLGPNRNDPDIADRVVESSVYPCPTCRPKQYLRWENGCMRLDHNPAECELCSGE